MYKQVDNYYAMMQVAAGQQAYAIDFNSMTIRDVAGMTVSEVDNNLTYIAEDPQSEENMGKTDIEKTENDTEEYKKTRENTESYPEKPSEEEKAEVEEPEKPKSSSADTDSEEVKSATRKKIEAEEKKRKKAEANAKFREETEQLRLTEQWVDLHAQGKTKTQIAKEYDKAVSTVSTHIEKYIKESRDKMDYGKFMALRKANWSNKKIASELHITEGAVTLIIERGL